MLKQYLELKDRYADALVLFQMGDFFELFFQDADEAARALSIALTSRSRSGEDRIPMAGFPIHAAQGYIGRLLEQGYKVVVCEQVEDPAQAKGLVRREVTRILTRGIQVDPNALEATAENYLAAAAFQGTTWGLAYLSLSTGEFRLTEGEGGDALGDELWRLKPAELLVPEGAGVEVLAGALAPFQVPPTRRQLPPFNFDQAAAHRELGRVLGTLFLDGFGLRTTAWGWPRRGPSSATSGIPTPPISPTWTASCLTPGTITWGWTKRPSGTSRSLRPGAPAAGRGHCWRSWTPPSPPWGRVFWDAGSSSP